MSSQMESLTPLTAEDLNGLNKCLFDWCDSIDSKDIDRLAQNIAPELSIDYRDLGLSFFPNMSATDYLNAVKKFIDNATMKTQHLIGASYFTKIAPDEAEGQHQIRAAHQVYTDESLTIAKLIGNGMASNTLFYRKIDGVWKLAGLRPKVNYSEYDFKEIMEIAAQSWGK